MYAESENGFWLLFLSPLGIYKFENYFWEWILSPGGIYFATCGQEDKVVFYLDMHIGICMKSLLGRLNRLLLLLFFYNKVVNVFKVTDNKIRPRPNCQGVVTTMICDSVLSRHKRIQQSYLEPCNVQKQRNAFDRV